MHNWHSLYEILQFPIGLLFLALLFLGTGNLLTNSVFSSLFVVKSTFFQAVGEICVRLGAFVITNFPSIFLIRLVTRKAGSATTIISAFCGYVAYAATTMCFSGGTLGATAYSSILGLSTTNLNVTGGAGVVCYPLQTGVVATAIVSIITLSCFNRSRRHSEYGFFAFVSKDSWCVLQTVLLCMLAGLAVTLVWPYWYKLLQSQIRFIASDTTNPINLIFYGILDRLLSLLNMGAIIRTPFWYGSSGGSWINIAGTNIIGDVNIWTSQLAASSLTGMAGRFITPYYVLNIFAIPGMLWALFSLITDQVERRRYQMFYIGVMLISWFSGSLLPVELMLFLLCPLLYAFHLMYSGLLFGILQIMRVYFGYRYSGNLTITAMPGTLPELLTYVRNPSMQRQLMLLLVVGAISAAVYFLATRFYFRHLAVDLFHTGDRERLVGETIKAVGGVSNIKMIHSSTKRLVVSLYDPTLLDIGRLMKLGSLRVYETKAGYAITFGAASTMVRIGIAQAMRDTIRTAKI